MSKPETLPSNKAETPFPTLRAANEARQIEWSQGNQITLAYRGNEFAGEAGEVCNVIKKLERERMGIAGSRDTKAHLAEELADAVICLDLIAMTAGIDLDAAVEAKFNATSEKVGLRTRYRRPLPEPVAIKPLKWRVPNDGPTDPDPEDNALCADGIGGVYAISKKQSVGPERLLWAADDPFAWTGHNSIAAAKAAAQADYEARILSAFTGNPASAILALQQRVMERDTLLRRLSAASLAFLRFFNPNSMPEDQSQQWHSVYDQADRARTLTTEKGE